MTAKECTQNEKTGYPSIDKPWLKYYSEDAINALLPECTIYEYIHESNRDYPDDIAMQYYGRNITFRTLFEEIDRAAAAFSKAGVKEGDIVTMVTVTTPETVYALYALNRLGAVSNMVDPRTSEEGIRDYIREVNGTIVLTIDVALPKVALAIEGTDVETLIVTSPFDSMPPVKRYALRMLSLLKGHSENSGTKSTRWNAFIREGAGAGFEAAPYRKNRCCVIVHCRKDR